MKYRNEWKYSCHENELVELGEKLGQVIMHDPHADDEGIYRIHSLYFDDPYNTCAFENVDGVNKRAKYRIRYYETDTNHLTLEKKEKLNSFCKKTSCRINKDIYDALVSGDVSEYLYGDNDPLLKEFAVDILCKGFRPTVIIDYEREAFVEPITNIRITFDKNITASNEIDSFLMQGAYMKYPLLENKRHILEVKFDDILPSYIRYIAEASTFCQQAFSKYYMGRAILHEMGVMI